MGQPRFTGDFKADAVKQITERGLWVRMFRSVWASAPTRCTLG